MARHRATAGPAPGEWFERLTHASAGAEAVVAEPQRVDAAGRPIERRSPMIVGRIVPHPEQTFEPPAKAMICRVMAAWV